MSKILDLRNKRNNLWEQTKAFLEEHRGENGLVAADAVEQYNKMAADVKALGDEIQRLEDQMEMDAKLSAATSVPVHADPKADGKRDSAQRPTATAKYSEAFWNMMRGNNSLEVRDALSVGVDQNGGFTVPDEFERQLIQGLEENNIFRTLAHTIHTNSGTRTIPIATDSGSASWIEEGAAIQESDMSFAQETLSAYKLGCMIKVSNELLNDSAFDIASHIARRFGVRFGNAEEDAFINGTGPSANPQTTPSQPTGILTSLTATAGNTTAYADAVHFDNIYKLYYSLKSPYAYYTISNNQGYEGDLELAMVPESFRTDILKESLDSNNVLVEDATAKTEAFALLFEFDGDVKQIRHVLYNCTAARPTIESSTTEDEIEVQTETLSITASPLSGGYVKARTSDTTSEAAYNAWYESVYIPNGTAQTGGGEG